MFFIRGTQLFYMRATSHILIEYSVTDAHQAENISGVLRTVIL